MKWVLVALALVAAPVEAQECFSGEPRQVTYDDGRVFTIIQRHGDDVTYTVPYEGFQDAVTKTQLMLFPKQGWAGARSTEFRWTSRLPKAKNMVPGFEFDIEGTMKSGDGVALPYRIKGAVLREEEVMVGKCSYPALVVEMDTYLNDELILKGTDHLSLEMTVVLKREVLPISSGQMIRSAAVALE
jgi:hypothetical protein